MQRAIKSRFALTLAAPILWRTQDRDSLSSGNDYDRLIPILHSREKVAHLCAKLAWSSSQSRNSFNRCAGHRGSLLLRQRCIVHYDHYVTNRP